MNKLRFGNIKKLNYNDDMPFEYVLVDFLYKKVIDVNFVLSCYTEALDIALQCMKKSHELNLL